MERRAHIYAHFMILFFVFDPTPQVLQESEKVDRYTSKVRTFAKNTNVDSLRTLMRFSLSKEREGSV
jgi:hypothetical protein